MAGENGPSFSQALSNLGADAHVAIFASLQDGARRLTELMEFAPRFDEETLSAALRDLDAEGFVARRVDPGPPLRVLYVLTDRGTEIAPALRTIADWSSKQR